jgi:threonine dehydrogenase-like Zn-dependent dehydrogenase
MDPAGPDESERMAQQLFGMIFSKVITHCLGAAAELGVADLLKDGERPIAELARATGAHERSLYRVLRTLAGSGVFAESQPGHFALTPLAEPLRSDSPNTLRNFAVFAAHPVSNAAYANAMHSVRTGETGFAHAHGAGIFDYFTSDPDFFSVFNDAMTSNSHREARAIARAYDFSRFGTLADVGGGLGFLLSEVLKTTPEIRGVLFDLPDVVARAQATFDAAGVADRVSIEGGSFFESVPARADAYMMKYIIHDWDDTRARTILENCLESMNPGGKVLVVDYVLPEGDDSHIGKLVDIEMLLIPGGAERTRSDFEALFASAGLRVERIVPTATPLSIVEGVRA